MQICNIANPSARQRIVRTVLQKLPDWFGISAATEGYIKDSAEQICIAAIELEPSLTQNPDTMVERPIGFLCLKETGKDTMEVAVMGVLKEYHRQGIGRSLFQKAKETAQQLGYSFLQVKTVKMGVYRDYDMTNKFYQSLGFQEFEVLPTLWNELNPCQIYVMSLK